MSNSLNFVKKIGKDPSRSDWTDRNWDNATEIDSSTKITQTDLWTLVI